MSLVDKYSEGERENRTIKVNRFYSMSSRERDKLKSELSLIEYFIFLLFNQNKTSQIALKKIAYTQDNRTNQKSWHLRFSNLPMTH
jgi:hypothetical protein